MQQNSSVFNWEDWLTQVDKHNGHTMAVADAAWAQNDLPPMIKASPTLLTFCQQLKTFLFQSMFYQLDWRVINLSDIVKRPCNIGKMLTVTLISA